MPARLLYTRGNHILIHSHVLKRSCLQCVVSQIISMVSLQVVHCAMWVCRGQEENKSNHNVDPEHVQVKGGASMSLDMLCRWEGNLPCLAKTACMEYVFTDESIVYLEMCVIQEWKGCSEACSQTPLVRFRPCHASSDSAAAIGTRIDVPSKARSVPVFRMSHFGVRPYKQ